MLILRGRETCCLCVGLLLIVFLTEKTNRVHADEDPPFTVPDGFLVQKVADDAMVHDCWM